MSGTSENTIFQVGDETWEAYRERMCSVYGATMTPSGKTVMWINSSGIVYRTDKTGKWGLWSTVCSNGRHIYTTRDGCFHMEFTSTADKKQYPSSGEMWKRWDEDCMIANWLGNRQAGRVQDIYSSDPAQSGPGSAK